jgi:hypothetical protein
MPPTNPTSEEVVEKKASAPVTTACLIIACIALLGGIIFQVMEITEYRSGPGDPKDQASKRYKTDIKNLKQAVEDTLSKATVGAVSEEGAAVAPTDTAPAVAPTDTAPAVAPTDTAPAVAPTDTAPTDTAPAVAPTDTAPAVAPTDTAPAVAPTDTAPTVAPTDTAPTDTADPGEGGAAGDTKDPPAEDTKTPPAGDQPKDATEGDGEK